MSLVLQEMLSLWRDAEQSDKTAFMAAQWIKCSERMPPENTPVLVYGLADNENAYKKEEIEPMIAVYEWRVFYSKIMNAGAGCLVIKEERHEYWHSVGDCGYEHEDAITTPTHWQPLPEPPGEGE